MKRAGAWFWLVSALILGATLPALLLVAGCELGGHYHDDTVDVQFGNTNAAVQVQAQ